MNTKNNQIVFNHICRTFIRDRKDPCVHKYGVCKYSPQNKKQAGCAIGCLLDRKDARKWDRKRKGDFYGSTIFSIQDDYPELYYKYFNRDQLGFLEELQFAHDNYAERKQLVEMARSLISIAEAYDLEVYEYVHEAAKEKSNA